MVGIAPRAQKCLSVALLLCAASCGSGEPSARRAVLPPTALLAPSAAASSSASASVQKLVVRAPETFHGRRLGTPARGFGSVLAVSSTAGLVGSSVSFRGADLEIWPTQGDGPVRRLKPELDQAVVAADFSPDGKEIVAALRGKPSDIVVLRASDESLLGKLEADASSVAFLGNGDVVFLDGSIRRWDRRTMSTFVAADATAPIVAFALSPDRKTMATATAAEIAVYRLDGATAIRQRSTKRKGTHELWIRDDGTIVGNDGAGFSIANGTASALGGTVVSVGGDLAVLRTDHGASLVSSRDGKQKRALRLSGILSPDGAIFVSNNGSDTATRHRPRSTASVLSGELDPPTAPAAAISFSLDGGELLVLDGSRVVSLEVATGKVVRSVELPIATPGLEPNSLFRGPRDVFAWGPAIYRLDSTGPVDVGSRGQDGARAFRAADGGVFLCLGSPRCQRQIRMEPNDRKVDGDQAVPFAVGLGSGRGFCEHYGDEGSDFGPCAPSAKISDPIPAPSPVWTGGVRTEFVSPTSPTGGVWVTWEGGTNRTSRFMVRSVDSNGVTDRCDLGSFRSADEPSAIHPSGKEVALLIDDAKGWATLVVDIDSCSGETYRLPARPLSSDYSPDGHRLAIGLEDGTIWLLEQQ